MPHWLIALLAVLLLNVLAVAGGARWQSIKPRAAHTPDSPAASPEEGTRS